MLASEQSGEYPRPQLVREDWVSLDGDWQFAYDDEDRGLSESWFAAYGGRRFDRSIVVPFPPESPASGIGDLTFHPIVWYRRELDAGDLLGRVADHDDDRILLHFGAVDYLADVWLDGQHLVTHVGGQTPFEVDVTDLLDGRPDHHVIVVRAVDDPVDMAQPRGKQDWEPTPHGIWYERTTGIWQPVWCERVPRRRIVGVTWRPNPAANSVAVDVEFTEASSARESVTIAFRLGDELLADVTVPVSGSVVTVEIPIPAMVAARDRRRFLWSPEQPTLIDAEISLYESYDHSSPVDRVFSYFGMRDVGVGQGRFLLNDEPYYVRAVMEQGYWPETHLAATSHLALCREVELAKRFGFNSVRIHQKAEDPRFLFYADTLGLLVWAETANAHEFSARAVELLTDEWGDIVRRDRSHPSIVAWVPINESWGVPDIATDTAQQSYVRDLVALTRALDPTRLVLGNEGWEQLDTDIIGVHDYDRDAIAIYHRYRDQKSVLATLDGPGPQARRLLVSDGVRVDYLQGNAPLMVTEFGGISFADESTWGYQVVDSGEEYASALRGLFGALQSCPPVAGFCFTQLTDTRQEANGLLTANREPKLPFEAVAEIVVGPPARSPRQFFAARWTKEAIRRTRRRLRPVKAFIRKA